MWERVYRYLDKLALEKRSAKYVVIYIRGENLWGYFSTIVIGTKKEERLFANDGLPSTTIPKGELICGNESGKPWI